MTTYKDLFFHFMTDVHSPRTDIVMDFLDTLHKLDIIPT